MVGKGRFFKHFIKEVSDWPDFIDKLKLDAVTKHAYKENIINVESKSEHLKVDPSHQFRRRQDQRQTEK